MRFSVTDSLPPFSMLQFKNSYVISFYRIDQFIMRSYQRLPEAGMLGTFKTNIRLLLQYFYF